MKEFVRDFLQNRLFGQMWFNSRYRVPPTVICVTAAVQASQWRSVMGKNGELF